MLSIPQIHDAPAIPRAPHDGGARRALHGCHIEPTGNLLVPARADQRRDARRPRRRLDLLGRLAAVMLSAGFAATGAVTAAPPQDVPGPVSRHFILSEVTPAGPASHFPGFDPITGNVLVSNVSEGTVSEVDPGEGVVRTFPVGVEPHTVQVNAQARRAYVTNKGSSTVSEMDLETGETVATFPVGPNPHGLNLDTTRGRIYVTSIDANQLEVYALAPPHDLLATVAVGPGPWGVDARGDLVVTTDTGGTTVHFIDAEALQVTDVVEVGPGPWNPSIGASGTVYATIGDAGQMVAVRDGAVAWRTDVGPAPRGIHADERRRVVFAAVAGADQVVFVDSRNGRLFQRVEVPDMPAGVTYDAMTGIAYVASQGAGVLDTLSPATAWRGRSNQ